MSSDLHLSDPELARKLRELGLEVGPINDSTRDVYIRKYKGLIQSKHHAPVSPRIHPPVSPWVRPYPPVSPRTHPPVSPVSTHPPGPTTPPADINPHSKSPLLTTPPDQPSGAGAVVELLLMSFDNLSHVANDTAFLFPSGEVIVASRAILTSQCSKMAPMLYKNQGSAIAHVCTLSACDFTAHVHVCM